VNRDKIACEVREICARDSSTVQYGARLVQKECAVTAHAREERVQTAMRLYGDPDPIMRRSCAARGVMPARQRGSPKDAEGRCRAMRVQRSAMSTSVNATKITLRVNPCAQCCARYNSVARYAMVRAGKNPRSCVRTHVPRTSVCACFERAAMRAAAVAARPSSNAPRAQSRSPRMQRSAQRDAQRWKCVGRWRRGGWARPAGA